MKKSKFRGPDFLRTFAPYYAMLKPVKWQFIGVILFGAINGALNGLGIPVLVFKGLPKVFNGEPPSGSLLILIIVLFPIVALIRGVTAFLKEYLSAFCGVRVLISIRARLYRKMQRLPLGFFGGMRVGDLMSRLVNDATAVQVVVTNATGDLINQPVQFIGAIIALVYMSFQKKEVVFILFALAIIPLCVLPIRYFGKRVKEKARRLQDSAGDLSTVINENLGAVREVRAFNLEDLELEKFDEHMRRIAKFNLKKVKYSKMLPQLIEFVAGVAVGIGVLYAAKVNLKPEDMIPLLLALYMT
jgi:subfamily B ATP-binding cassette protein MsbA